MNENEISADRPAFFFITDDDDQPEPPRRTVVNDDLPFTIPESGFDRYNRIKRFPISQHGDEIHNDDDERPRPA